MKFFPKQIHLLAAILLSGILGIAEAQPALHTATTLIENPDPDNVRAFGASGKFFRDVDGDGVVDFLLSGVDIEADPDKAVVFILSGSDQSVIERVGVPGTKPYDSDLGLTGLYSPVSVIDDLTGDGVPEFTVTDTATAGSTVHSHLHLFDGETFEFIYSVNTDSAIPFFGFSVSRFPDISGNGTPEILVGAPGFVGGGSPEQSGGAFIVEGSSGEILRTTVSPEPREHGSFGWRVAVLDDVNGDGMEDYVVSEPGLNSFAPTEGIVLKIHLFDGQTGQLIRSITDDADEPTSQFGVVMKLYSDLNGDGIAELMVNKPRARTGSIQFFDPVNGDQLREILPLPDVHGLASDFGWQFEVIGDVDGDAVLDLAATHLGRIEIRSGTDGAILGVTAPFLGDLLSSHDQNGDGVGDFLMGNSHDTLGDPHGPRIGSAALVFSPYSHSESEASPGMFEFAEAVVGAATAESATFTITSLGEAPVEIAFIRVYEDLSQYRQSPHFTVSANVDLSPIPPGATREVVVSFAPKVIGTATAHLIIVTNDLNRTMHYIPLIGEATIEAVDPEPGPPPSAIFIENPEPDSIQGFGVATSFFRDVDGDGVVDFLVTGIDFDAALASAVVFVMSGSDQTVIDRIVVPKSGIFRSLESYPAFVHQIHLVGDLTGDGIPEFAVAETGAAGEGPNFLDDYSQLVIFDGANLESLYHVDIDSSYSLIGHSVSPHDDITEDGVPDLVVGVPGASLESPSYISDAGLAFVISGSNGGIVHTLESPEPGFSKNLGTSVVSLPDLNGDGVSEIAVGEPALNQPNVILGSVHIYDGKTGDLIKSLEDVAENLGGSFGWFMSRYPDMTGDGVDELIISEPIGSKGRVYIYDLVNEEVLRRFAPPPALEDLPTQFGYYFRLIGDVDEDGYVDLAIDHFGRVEIWSASSGEMLGATVHSNSDLAAGEDLNGDGVSELLIGNHLYGLFENPDQVRRGRATLAFSPYQGSESTVDLETLTFEPAVVGSATPEKKRLILTNTGSNPLEFLRGGIFLEGEPFSPHFKVIQPNDLSPIPLGGTREFEVEFAPQSAGSHTAHLVIVTNDLDRTMHYIPLTGEGIGDETPTPTPTETSTPTPTPTPAFASVVRHPAGGGDPIQYESLAHALTETGAGDRLVVNGNETIDAALVIEAPDVTLEGDGGSTLFQGAGLAPHEPLLRIAPSAQNARVAGLRFQGLGESQAPKGTSTDDPDFDSETFGAVGLDNDAQGTEIVDCRFDSFGSGGFAGVGAVLSGNTNDAASLRLNNCRFETNSTAIRVAGGSLQMFECESWGASFADLIQFRSTESGGDPSGVLNVELMDCRFESEEDQTIPRFRIFAAGSPTDLEAYGCRIGPALVSNIVFGDGTLRLVENAVYNLDNPNIDLLTLASLSNEGVPTHVTVDRCDLYNHGLVEGDWLFGEGKGALIRAGEVDDGEGSAIAPCHLIVRNSILGGAGGDDVGIAFHRIGGASPSQLHIANSLIVMEGVRRLGADLVGWADSISSVEYTDPFYARVDETASPAELDFHYARNSIAASLGNQGEPIGSQGPDEVRGVWVSPPTSVLPQGDLVTLPFTIDDASGVVRLEWQLSFDPQAIANVYAAIPGSQFEGAAIQMTQSDPPGQIDYTFEIAGSPTVEGEAVVLLTPLNLASGPKPDSLILEITSGEGRDAMGNEIRLQSRDGELLLEENDLPGNADLNDRLDTRDVVTVLRHIVRIEEMRADAVRAADVVDPGVLTPPDFVDPISIEDAVWIYQEVTGGAEKISGDKN